MFGTLGEIDKRDRKKIGTHSQQMRFVIRDHIKTEHV